MKKLTHVAGGKQNKDRRAWWNPLIPVLTEITSPKQVADYLKVGACPVFFILDCGECPFLVGGDSCARYDMTDEILRSIRHIGHCSFFKKKMRDGKRISCGRCLFSSETEQCMFEAYLRKIGLFDDTI